MDDQALLEQAIVARGRAYAPYSGFTVGAALECESGRVVLGCNVENASYPVSICAERTALVKAVSEGQRKFDVIAVATRNGGSPCGMCRQMLYEFAPDLRVVLADLDGNITGEVILSDLLPDGFGPQHLKI